MHSFRTLALLATLSVLAIASLPAGCEKKPAPSAPTGGASPAQSDHAHKDGDGHNHGAATPAGSQSGHGDDHAHGPTVQLGQQEVGGLTIRASRDGAVTPGKDVPIDVWVTGPKPTAVRFWIGTQDAKGSVKAKAALEKDNWHSHAEVPSPLPAGSKLWVEIETAKGERLAASFDLNT